MPHDLTKQFEALWESSDSPPDPFAFLEQHNGSDSTDKLAVLLQDQQHRWKTDQPLKVEDYLNRLPELDDCKLQLAVGEFQARQNGDTSPNVDEFTSRFSDISEELRSKLSKLPDTQISARLRSICMSSGMTTKKSATCLISAADGEAFAVFTNNRSIH